MLIIKIISQLYTKVLIIKSCAKLYGTQVTENQRRSDSSLSSSPVSVLEAALGSTPNSDIQLTLLSPQTNPVTSTVMLSSVSIPQQPSQQQQQQQQGSSQPNQAAAPQRPVPLQANLCSPENGGGQVTGLTAVSQSEGAAEGLTLSNRTNDPVIASAGANVPTGSATNNRLTRTNGDNNTLPSLRMATDVLNENG